MLACIAALAMSVPSLANPKSTPETVRTFAMLRRIYGKAIIAGQCDDKYLPFIEAASGGQRPALMGYDFNGVPPSQATNKDVPKAIAWHRKGGLVTFQWHWISPNADGDFYTDKFNLAEALRDRQGESYRNLIRDMDLVAEELKKLRNAGVPVLWRPLHEAEGKWVWWGKSGGVACRQLWRLMFVRYTRHHGLNNLIWIWTSYGKEKENWYPGDDTVDLIVRDYESATAWAEFQELFGKSGKMFGLGEEGKRPDPESLKDRPWLYFLTWATMIEDPSKGNTKDWIRKVYNDPRVVTLDRLASWRSG
jgi:mannan endo-1,4-beta-mannosidase